MALTDNLQALLDAGYQEHEIKQALRQALEAKQLAEHDAGLPAIPTLGPVLWAGLKAKLTSPTGPTNKLAMLKLMHDGLDTDDQVKFWRGLFGLVKAAWAEHAGYRRNESYRPPI